MASVELAALLALGAAVGIGLSTVGVGIGLERIERARGASPVVAAAFVTILVTVVIFWVATLARGAPFDGVSVLQLWPLLAAGVLYPGLFRLLYYTGIDRVGANVTGALVAGNPAIAAMLAVVSPMLDERFTLATGVGILLIVGGGALLQLAQTDPDAEPGEQDLIVRELAASSPADFAFPVGALLAVGVGYFLIDVGLQRFSHPVAATAVTQTAGFVAFSAYLLVSRDARGQLRTAATHRGGLLVFVASGVAVAAAWLSQFLALNIGTVVVVIPLVNTYPLVIAVASYGIARQFPRSPRVVGGVLAIVAGASVIQL